MFRKISLGTNVLKMFRKRCRFLSGEKSGQRNSDRPPFGLRCPAMPMTRNHDTAPSVSAIQAELLKRTRIRDETVLGTFPIAKTNQGMFDEAKSELVVDTKHDNSENEHKKRGFGDNAHKPSNFEDDAKDLNIQKEFWKHYSSSLFMLLFGMSEIFLGAALTVFCFRSGGLLGKCLMSDGVYELMNAVKCHKRCVQVTWRIQKLASIAVIFASVGLDAMEDAFKTTIAGIKEMHFDEGKESTLVMLEGWHLVSNVIALEFAKGISVECLFELFKHYSDRSLLLGLRANIKPLIDIYVRRSIDRNIFLKQLLKSDFKREDKNSLVNTIANKMKVNKANDETVATALLKRFLVVNTTTTSYVLMASFVFFELNQQMFGLVDKLNDVVQEICEEKEYSKLANLESEEREILSKSRLGVDKLNDHTSFNKDLSNHLSNEASTNITLVLLNIILYPFLRRYLHIAANDLVSRLDLSVGHDIQYYTAKKRILICQSGDINRIDKSYIDKSVNGTAIRKAITLIDDTIDGAEAGLPHLGALSVSISRPIRVLDWGGNLCYTVGGTTGLEPIEVQYHRSENIPGSGHWTLPNAVEPIYGNSGTNDCLFNAIAYQTGRDAYELRSRCARIMNEKVDLLAGQIADMEYVKSRDTHALMMGGAKYDGRGADDARRVIDASQGVSGHGHHPRGHPRGHASSASADSEGSVENYSRRSSGLSDAKSGFQDRSMQDEVGHAALSSADGQTAMRLLNGGSTREAITVPARELPGVDHVRMAKWYDGQRQTDYTAMRSVTLVLQHHEGQQNNPDADVHVHTLYPRD